jgi:hypothetical protein
VVDNNDSPNNTGPCASSGLPTTTADLLRHRAARRSSSIGGSGGNALSALEASGTVLTVPTVAIPMQPATALVKI